MKFSKTKKNPQAKDDRPLPVLQTETCKKLKIFPIQWHTIKNTGKQLIHSKDLQLAPAMSKCLNEAMTFQRTAQTQQQESLTSG